MSGEPVSNGIVEALSTLLAGRLHRDQILALRTRYHRLRTRLYPILRLVNGTFGADELRRHLEQRLEPRFEILMVHSSVNHLEPMYTGTPLELLRMLMDLCGPERTLAMPAFYFGDPRIDDAVESYRRQPTFDVRRTPSQMGMLTEMFRRTKGVQHSLHPTHRICALGPLATKLTSGHETAGSTFGRGTPFEFMAAHDTLILGIGKRFDVLTQVHHVEDLLDEAFPAAHEVATTVVTMRDDRGLEHSYTLRLRRFQRPREMSRLPRFMSGDRLRAWRFHGVPLFAARARYVTDDILAAARHGRTVYGDTPARPA